MWNSCEASLLLVLLLPINDERHSANLQPYRVSDPASETNEPEDNSTSATVRKKSSVDGVVGETCWLWWIVTVVHHYLKRHFLYEHARSSCSPREEKRISKNPATLKLLSKKYFSASLCSPQERRTHFLDGVNWQNDSSHSFWHKQVDWWHVILYWKLKDNK